MTLSVPSPTWRAGTWSALRRGPRLQYTGDRCCWVSLTLTETARAVIVDQYNELCMNVCNFSLFSGGLYEATNAAQGKAGSSTDVMSPAKLKISMLGNG